MDLYVSPIPKWATPEQVETEIATALHTEPVLRRGQERTNFALKLLTRQDGTPYGHAYLTIPEPTTANRFLEKCAVGRRSRPVILYHDDQACVLQFRINGFAKARDRLAEERRLQLQAEALRLREDHRQREERRRALDEQQRAQARAEQAQRSKAGIRDRAERRKAVAKDSGNDKKPRPVQARGDSQSEARVKTKAEARAPAVAPKAIKDGPDREGRRKTSTSQRDGREAEHLLDLALPDPGARDIASLASRLTSFESQAQSSPAPGPRRTRGTNEVDKNAAYGRPGAWRTIAFGVICHDGTFSIEDEERLAVPLPAALSEHTQTVIFGNERTNGVKILYNTLVRWSIHEQEVTFELDRPATFIRNGRVSTYWCFKAHQEDDPNLMERRRYCAPYVGCAFRVVFTSHEELDAFLLHAKRVFIRAGNLSEPRWGVKRSLFRASHLDAIQSLCARLSIPLAFQVERLFLNALLFPPDVHDLEYFVSRSIRDRGEAATAVLVMNLAVSIQRTRAMHGTREAETHLDLRELWAREAKRLSHAKSTAEDPLSVGLGATFEVYNATVTPTRVILAGPVVDTSNRVLRAYPEHAHHFLRVSFADEDFDRFPVGRRDLREVDAESFVHERIGGILKDGITVAGRKWDMLAWSGSSLRTHQCWFSTPFVDDQGRRWTADLIRQGLGAFSEVERFPARFGARLSQAFSATAPTIRLRDEWVEVVDDIRSPTGNLFTDGVGQISPKLMQAVWLEYCRVKMMINERRREVLAAKVPSAIQVRIGGAKGVLCVNPLLTGMKVKLRPSMIKFSAPKHTEVEVATSSLHPLPTRLNRPLINALEDLGVGFANFLVLQRLAVEEVNQARLSFKAASELCKRYGFGTAFGSLAVFEKLQTLLGLAPQQLDATGILNRLIGTSISAALGDLKRKARIPTLGPTLIGVADEFGFLRKDQIFAQVEEKDGRTRVIEGMILIGRSPTIHPGDTRMVRAVAPPKDHPLMQLRNVVVFSCEAHGRSLPSMLGGGDLDGDIYSLYEEPLLFINRNFAPGTYKQPKNKQLNRTCKPADLADFFTDFVINDQIGVVSHLHLHISDRSDEHSLDPDCVKLASLHAQAVDFCKTGQAVHRRDMPYLPFRSNRPDYLAQNDHAPDVYKSKRALGRLYRDIAWTDTDMPLGPAQIWLSGDGDGDGDQAAPSATSDIVAILDAVGARFPYARPTSQQAERAIQERCTPLLRSFTYHLSRIAAWVPESRHTAEWLREEEIILGSPVMATTSKLKRWQEKLQSATSELVPILRHQLGVIVTGGDPLAIRRAGRTDLDAQLQHRNFGTGRGETYDETCRAALERAEAAPQHETVVERTGLVVDVDVEVDGERGRTALDRLGVEGELVPSFAGISLSEAKKGSGGGGGALTHENIDHDDDDDELEEIRGLFAACLLGAHDVISRSFGGSTFALVALGSLLNLIEAREKRLATRPVPLR